MIVLFPSARKTGVDSVDTVDKAIVQVFFVLTINKTIQSIRISFHYLSYEDRATEPQPGQEFLFQSQQSNWGLLEEERLVAFFRPPAVHLVAAEIVAGVNHMAACISELPSTLFLLHRCTLPMSEASSRH